MFEQQYNDLALAVDEIAERIRALGFLLLQPIQNLLDSVQSRRLLVCLMLKKCSAYWYRGRSCCSSRSISFPIVDQAHDEPTADLLTQRMQFHEKTAWMLRSLLEK
jgi:starvation-inducible DNA-binding protein